MSARPDVEEIQPTRTERLLAFVLAAFVLLGAIWTYQKIDDVIRSHEPVPQAAYNPGPATRAWQVAQGRLDGAQVRERRALQRLELRREAYRTALDAHRPAAKLGRQYDAAQAAYAQARRDLVAARRQVRATAPAAREEERRSSARVTKAQDRQDRDIFFARVGMVLLGIVLAFLLLARLRRRPTRWYPLASSVVAAATIFAFVFAADYVTDYIDPLAWGVALVALVGVVCTLLAYWSLQRYLARRLPQRRVRKDQCPFCGFPARGEHCEGCGRRIVAPCAKCESPRRVGTAHCAACGEA
jgi:hypothetical protein